MYQRYPGQDQSPEPAQERALASAPQSVIRAARVMYVGAAASVIGIVIDLLQRHSIRNAIVKHNPSLTASKVTTTYHAELVILVVAGLIAAGLWIWMARANLAGKSWARIVSTVLFAIETISVISSATVVAGGGATRVYAIVVWVIGLVAIVLLWQRSSSAYFRATPR